MPFRKLCYHFNFIYGFQKRKKYSILAYYIILCHIFAKANRFNRFFFNEMAKIDMKVCTGI